MTEGHSPNASMLDRCVQPYIMTYTLQYHGDVLERTHFDFIQNYFPTYEKVWAKYIGNNGLNIKADILGFSNERNEGRQKFSEHSYTILVSFISLKQIIDSLDAFKSLNSKDAKDILRIHDTLLLFFSNLGRINDNLIEAGKHFAVNAITQSLAELYHKRHIIVHGSIIPIIFHESGDLYIPHLSKSSSDTIGWNHKEHNWNDITLLRSETIEISLSDLFFIR